MALKPLEPLVKLLSLSRDKCLYAKVKLVDNNYGTVVDEGNSNLKLGETVPLKLDSSKKFFVMGV